MSGFQSTLFPLMAYRFHRPFHNALFSSYAWGARVFSRLFVDIVTSNNAFQQRERLYTCSIPCYSLFRSQFVEKSIRLGEHPQLDNKIQCRQKATRQESTMATFANIFSKLPAELKVMVLGFAVSTDKPIDLRKFDDKLDALTDKFKFRADRTLWLLAEEEALKSNIFVLNGDDARCEWITDDIGRTPSRWSETVEPSTRNLPAISLHPIVGCNLRPHLFSVKKGQISTDARQIRHLEVRFSIVAAGCSFHQDKPLIADAKQVLTSLTAAFPKLESLHVEVHDKGRYKRDAVYRIFGIPFPAAGSSRFVVCERNDKLLEFYDVVSGLDFRSARRGHQFEKTFTLIQKLPSSIAAPGFSVVANADGTLPRMQQLEELTMTREKVLKRVLESADSDDGDE